MTRLKNPIYCQLNDKLRELIRGGEFKAGDKFPAEREIGERFGVSRVTANKAVSHLVAEGVLEFKKGVGTFVRGGVLDYDLAALVSFTDKARSAGKEPSTRVLRFGTVPAAQAGAETLGALRVQPHDQLYYVERLRLADRVPVILERRHIVARFCTGLDKEAVKGSLYAALTQGLKLEVAGADEVIRAVAIRDADARLLQIPNGTAGLLVTSVGYLSGGVPLWRELTLYRGDAYEFHNRLGPIQAARPAAGVLLDLSRTKR
ncbi:MAG: GntR family transcriptional regulator [Verrucomicrobia bacterium]|nr:GntR family transcriptional regulator [Verrucomicrobiota bacterium]